MSRIHGSSGRVYMNLTSGGTAESVTFLTDWEISFATDKVDVTALTDSNKIYVAGRPDASGSFKGFYDDATVQTYTAAVDGVARKFYLYPGSGTAQYFWGTILPDFKVSSSVSGAVAIDASWNAASTIAKQG